jgi:MFS family permease
MMMTNGFGAIIGSVVSGIIIDQYFTSKAGKDWHGIWITFALYALLIAISFAILFKHKHNPNVIKNVHH